MTIGEFAAASQLTPRMLRHYHKLGLLDPADIDEVSGYRYYRADQLQVAAVISQLRQAGVPLRTIAKVITDPESAGEVLEGHRRRLTAEHAAAVRRLDGAVHLVEEGAPVSLDIAVARLDPMLVIAKRVEGPRSFADPLLTAAFLELSRAARAAGVEHAPPLQLIHSSTDAGFVHDACIPIGPDDHVEGYERQELPAVNVATATSHGPFAGGLNTALRTVIAWIKDREWQMKMPIRMEFLAAPPLLGADGEPGTTITRLHVPYDNGSD